MGHLKVGAGFGLVKICWFGAAGRRPHTQIYIFIYIYIYIRTLLALGCAVPPEGGGPDWT